MCIDDVNIKWLLKENCTWQFHKNIKVGDTTGSSNSTSGSLQKYLKALRGYFCIFHIHSSSIHKSQKMETAQVSTDGRMDKQVWCIYIQWDTIRPKRRDTVTHATKQIILRTQLSERKTLYNPTLWSYLKEWDSETNYNGDCQGWREKGRRE